MRKIQSSLVLASTLLALAGCGTENGGSNQPGSVPYQPPGPNGEIRGLANFATLIQRFSQGKVSRMPWAGYWWPFAQNGTSAATAKYDKVRGASATDWELSHHGNANAAESWFGHCNGWAAAAVLYPEPHAAKTVGGISFGIADQKALLSEVAMEVNATFFGLRASGGSGPAFDDNSPDQFFLVLTNYVGNGLPVIIDRYTGDQIWNQPLAGYRIGEIRPEDNLGTDPSAPNVHRVMVTTQIWWLRDDVDGSHQTEAFNFADGPSYESRTLRYEVWLDGPPVFSGGKLTGSGNVIMARQGQTTVGGAWHNGNMNPLNSHPDYMWVVQSIAPSQGFANPRIDAGWVAQQFGGGG